MKKSPRKNFESLGDGLVVLDKLDDSEIALKYPVWTTKRIIMIPLRIQESQTTDPIWKSERTI